MPPASGTQSIDRAAQLLVAVADSVDPIGVGELAEATDLPKSTVSRLVAALERHALVQRDGARGPLRPGPVMLRLARRGVGDRDLVGLSADSLRRLAEASEETINLAVPTPLGVEHLSQVDSPHFIGSSNWIGRRVPHQTTAVGKVFLAYGAVRLPGSSPRSSPSSRRCGRAATRPRSASSSRGSRRWPRPCAPERATCSRRSRSPARSTA